MSDYFNRIMLETVSNEFYEALVWAAMVFERCTLHFKCNSIKVLFKIFIQLCSDVGVVLFEVFNCGGMGEANINTPFVFSVCKDIRGECIRGLKAVVEVSSNKCRHVSFNGM